jgi:hypothetical protein
MNQQIIKEELTKYIDINGINIIEKKIYINIDDNKWKSQKKYYENNKEELKKYVIQYKKNRYQTDIEYREKIKAKRRESYAKKKLENIYN